VPRLGRRAGATLRRTGLAATRARLRDHRSDLLGAGLVGPANVRVDPGRFSVHFWGPLTHTVGKDRDSLVVLRGCTEALVAASGLEDGGCGSYG
jgi:hypothetical protein